MHQNRIEKNWGPIDNPRGKKNKSFCPQDGNRGTTDSAMWHECLGHPSGYQTKTMIRQNMIPNEAESEIEGEYHRYLKSEPSRRPVPKTPERSGEMIMGRIQVEACE